MTYNTINFSDTQYNFDTVVNHTENALSVLSMTPGVGFVTGGLKIVIGLVQAAVAGILYLVFKALDNVRYRDYANIHFKHGLANIAAGFIEAIPLAGLLMGLKRMCNEHKEKKERSDFEKKATVESAHKFKFMSYPSLEIRDVVFGNCSAEISNELQDQYQQMIKGKPNVNYYITKLAVVSENQTSKNLQKVNANYFIIDKKNE